MWRIFIGAALIVAGIAAFIEVHSHAPSYEDVCRQANGEPCPNIVAPSQHHFSVLESGHLSQTPHDLLRIGAWALVIFGGLLVIVGLIAYVRSGRTVRT